MGYCQFLRESGVKLFPGQEELARVAFDGEGTSSPMAERIFGQALPPQSPSTPLKQAWQVFIAVCGARSGKSYIFGGLRMLYLALTVDLSKLAPGEEAFALIVAPDVRLGKQTLRYALGLAEKRFGPLVQNAKDDSFQVRRSNGQIVTIEVLPATKGGSAVRGRSLVGGLMDEAAFFRDDNFAVNDIELYNAISPRLLPGGQLVIASTAYAKAGLLYELYKEYHGKAGRDGESVLAAWAPTSLMRPDPDVLRHIERYRRINEQNARREFDAEFMASGTGTFFSSDEIDRAVRPFPVYPLPPPGPMTGVVAGGDFAFRRDSSACAIVHIPDPQRPPHEATRILANLIELQPQNDIPLRPGETVKYFARELKSHQVPYLMADQHYRESITEHLVENDLSYVPAPLTTAEIYIKARHLFRQGLVQIPETERRLIAQLREVQATATSSGTLTIRLPRHLTGGHGDLASAFMLALFQDAFHVIGKPGFEDFTPEWEEQQLEQRRRAFIDKLNKTAARRRDPVPY